MKSKIVLVIAALLVVAGGVYLVVTSSSPFKTDYAKYLPDSTLVVVSFNNPKILFNYVDSKKYPFVFEEMKKGSEKELGFDATDVNSYKEKGIDIDRPFGFALIDVVNAEQPIPIGTMFISISDQKKFEDFLKGMLQKQNMKVEEKQIASIPCRLVKAEEQLMSLYCFQGGFCFLYAIAGPVGMGGSEAPVNLEKQFEKDFGAKEKLAKNKNFQNALCGLEDGAEIYSYINIKQGIETTKKFHMEAGILMEQIATPDALALAFGGKISGKNPHISCYALCTKEMAKKYKAEGSCKDILKKLPKDPMICISSNSNVKAMWNTFKDNTDKALSSKTLEKEIPLEFRKIFGKAKNVDALLKLANEAMKQHFNVDIDIENDIISNIQGNAVFAMYNLPSQKAVDFDTTIVIKLNDGKKMTDLLSKVVKALGQLPLQEFKEGDATGYVFDLKGVPKADALSPTFGVTGNYLLITSKRDIFTKIVKGESSGMLSSIADKSIAKAIKEGYPNAGYINLKALVKEALEKLVPPDDRDSDDGKKIIAFINHLENITFQSIEKSNGLSSVISLKSDEDFFDLVFKTANEEIKAEKGR